MIGRQSQRGGDLSQQIQVQGDYRPGLTLDEATRAAELAARNVVAEEFAKGDQLGLQRIEELNRRVLARLDALEMLDVFADPAFQVSFRKAQIGAASTEREDDYELLAGLLEDRALRGQDRHVRAGLNIAVQVVDQLDAQALNGLTLLSAAATYLPKAGLLDQGLDALNGLFGQLPTAELPEGQAWIDHLDVLGALRPIALWNNRPYEQMLASGVPGYLATGLQNGSEEMAEVMQDLLARGVMLQMVEHELKPGWSRPAWCSLETLEESVRQTSAPQERIQATLEIASSAFGMASADPSLHSPFSVAIDTRPNLKRVREWWNALPVAINITPVGRLLARANAQRLDGAKLLPPLT